MERGREVRGDDRGAAQINFKIDLDWWLTEPFEKPIGSDLMAVTNPTGYALLDSVKEQRTHGVEHVIALGTAALRLPRSFFDEV